MSLVHRARLEWEKEIEALEKAVQINPGWSPAARELALALVRHGQLPRARRILEQAIARTPLDALNHGCLADVLWKLGEKPAARERLRQALRLDPGYVWGWHALREWARELGEPQLAAQLGDRRHSHAPIVGQHGHLALLEQRGQFFDRRFFLRCWHPSYTPFWSKQKSPASQVRGQSHPTQARRSGRATRARPAGGGG